MISALLLACVFSSTVGGVVECGNCSVTAGHDAISSGIIVPPIPNATTVSCCAACKANPGCEAFITGPCNGKDPVCKHWPDPTVNACYLVKGYRGLKPSADRTTGCIRGPSPTPPKPPKPPTPPTPPTPQPPTAGWNAGWGFKVHNGLPPMPTKLQSRFQSSYCSFYFSSTVMCRYFLNQSVVGYFVANNTGLASSEELAAEAKLGIMGIGWNLDHLDTSKTGGLEGYEVEQAAQLKKARSVS